MFKSTFALGPRCKLPYHGVSCNRVEHQLMHARRHYTVPLLQPAPPAQPPQSSRHRWRRYVGDLQHLPKVRGRRMNIPPLPKIVPRSPILDPPDYYPDGLLTMRAMDWLFAVQWNVTQLDLFDENTESL